MSRSTDIGLFLFAAVALTSCGYHLAGTTNLLPKNIQTIAIPAFSNGTTVYKLTDGLSEAMTREFISRTKYTITSDPRTADATLRGWVNQVFNFPTVYDPVTFRAANVEVHVNLRIQLTDKSGKVLFDRPSMEVRERYEVSVDPITYFDESEPAMRRLSVDVAKTIVSAILEFLMSPAQFLGAMKKGMPAPAYLFLGSEGYDRRRCKQALLDAHLAPEERAEGLTNYDLSRNTIAEVVDDARSLSLFASKRLIVVSSAEGALPKVSKAASDSDEEDGGASGGSSDVTPLVEYLRNPSPGVVVLFEATRFGLEGDDKKKAERVAKFFSPIQDVVEFAPYSPDDARREAQAQAKKLGVALEPAAMELLVEALGADMARIATELEKLSLLSVGRPVNEDDIQSMVPDARASTIFALVNALGRRDRGRSLAVLDTLCRDGEYLPLALAFLSSQFRQALIAREANLRSSQQIQGHFTKLGVPMWSSRADQVLQTATKFSREQLERGMKLIFETDRDLRSARPDDRIVMENFVVKLTA